MACNYRTNLPVELHYLMINSLPKSDLLSLRQTCRYFNTLCVPYILREIVKEIEDLDAPGLYLHNAAANCRHDILRTILELRPPLNKTNEHSETALHVAVRRNCVFCVQTLISSGADVSSMTFHCWSPLMLAARYGYTEIAALLLEAGAAPNVKGFRGWTALHISRRFGHDDVGFLLKSAGGDFDVADNDGIKAKETANWTKCWGAI